MSETNTASLRRIAVASEPTDGQLSQAIALHMELGNPMSEIEDALSGTDWRYLISCSGSKIEVEHVAQLLLEYKTSLQILWKQAKKLRVQDMEDVDDAATLSQTFIRTKVAHQARAHELTGLRVERFLLPSDIPDLDIDDDITNLLAQRGFEWNGGDVVIEIWSDEHQRKFEESSRKLEEINRAHMESKAKSEGLTA